MKRTHIYCGIQRAAAQLGRGLIWSIVVGSIAACSGRAPTQVDLILTNGNIATIDKDNSFATTVVVHDGRIVAVGDAAIADAYEARDTIDLGGKTMLPGFVDNHVHPRPNIPLPEGVVDLRYVYTWEENEALLREAAEKLKPGEWLRATAFRLHFADDAPATPWFADDLSRVPNRRVLDELAPNNPAIVRVGQFVVANSLALKIGGITRNSKAPRDGRIEKDAEGEPTGILWYSVGDALEAKAPPIMPGAEAYWEAMQDISAFKRFFENLRDVGVTSANIAGAMPAAQLRMYQELQASNLGELPRMTIQPWLNAGDNKEVVEKSIATLEGFGFRTGVGNEWLKLGAIKMGLDGGYTFSRPWALNEESHRYVDTYHGAWRDDPEFFYPIMKRAHELGWQLGVHAAGDRAARMVTDAFERILAEHPRQDHRHHLIHFEIGPNVETYEKMRKLNLGVAMQPNFIYSLQPFFSLALEGDRLQNNNPGRSVLDSGLHLSYGSDERPYGPLVGIYAAVTRRGYDGQLYGEKEAVTVTEAVRAYTIDSAWHTFDENNRGSIEVGKLADFVVLSEDIFTIDPSDIKEVKVLKTIIGGRIFDISLDAKNRFYPL